MVVADSEVPQLKNWVVKNIESISEADPEILSEYVVALLQHDESVEKLRELCLEQLQEFLHTGTAPFVNSLLKAYESKSYLNSSPADQEFASRLDLSTANVAGGDDSYDPANRSATSGANFNNDKNQGNFNNNNNNNYRYNNNNDDFSGQRQFRNNFRNGRGNRQEGFGFGNNNNNYGRNNFNNGGDRNNQGFNGNRNQNNYGNNGNPGFQNGFNPQAMPWMNQSAGFNMNTPFNNNNNNNGSAPQGFMGNPGFMPEDSGASGSNFGNNNNNNFQQYPNHHYQHRRRQDGGVFSIATTEADSEFTKKKLIVEKLPDDKFNQESLKEYFSQFGQVVSINLDQKQHLAELEFGSHNEARAAWSSSAPIFDNRFVKVYWRKKEENEDSEQKIDVEAVKQVQAQKQKEWEEKLAKKQENIKKMKELLEKQAQLVQMQKEQQELLLKHAEQTGNSEDVGAKRTLTQNLEAQLEALKREADSLGITGGAPSSYRGGYRGRGRGGYNSGYSPYGRPYRGRGGYHNTSRYNLDLRPKTVTVSPVPSDKEEALRGYLMSIGEYEGTNRLKESPETVSVTFKDRKTAEQFFYGAKDIPDIGPVEKAWRSTPATPATPSSTVVYGASIVTTSDSNDTAMGDA